MYTSLNVKHTESRCWYILSIEVVLGYDAGDVAGVVDA